MSRTDRKRPPQIIAAQPGYAVATPCHGADDRVTRIM